MVERVASGRALAIQEFAASLRDLRATAGTPSFREMSARSQAISHTTLHEAAQGLRLPSWATTVEYVKACGADPDDYRAAWEQADAAVKAGAAGEPTTTPATTPAVMPAPTLAAEPVPVAATTATATGPAVTAPPEPPPAPPPVPVSVTASPSPSPRRRRTLAFAVTAAAAVAAAVTGVVLATTGGDDDHSPASDPTLTAADCPVQQSNPPPVEPATAGDRAAFISDLTLPDCSEIDRGETVVKTWRFKNVGTVPWVGYSLHRVDLPQSRDQCQTIEDIAIDDTAPGDTVDVSVTVTAPQQAAFCFVRFKVENATGQLAFPAARPVNFQIVVV